MTIKLSFCKVVSLLLLLCLSLPGSYGGNQPSLRGESEPDDLGETRLHVIRKPENPLIDGARVHVRQLQDDFRLYTFECVLTFGFEAGTDVSPGGEEIRDLARLTDIYFTRVVAQNFGLPYEDVLVNRRGDETTSSFFILFFDIVTTFRFVGDVPSMDAVLVSILSTDLNDYIDKFVHVTFPPGVFQNVNEVVLTAEKGPTPAPSPMPTPISIQPTLSIMPSTAPSVSAAPSASPSKAPTGPPTPSPSMNPTGASQEPSASPSVSPSSQPSASPSTSPSASPSASPSSSPSSSPSMMPSPGMGDIMREVDGTYQFTFFADTDPIDPIVEQPGVEAVQVREYNTALQNQFPGNYIAGSVSVELRNVMNFDRQWVYVWRVTSTFNSNPSDVALGQAHQNAALQIDPGIRALGGKFAASNLDSLLITHVVL